MKELQGDPCGKVVLHWVNKYLLLRELQHYMARIEKHAFVKYNYNSADLELL